MDEQKPEVTPYNKLSPSQKRMVDSMKPMLKIAKSVQPLLQKADTWLKSAGTQKVLKSMLVMAEAQKRGEEILSYLDEDMPISEFMEKVGLVDGWTLLSFGHGLNEKHKKNVASMVKKAKEDEAKRINDLVKKEASEKGRHARIKGLERSPKQEDKNLVYGCWREWQEDANRYKSKAAFDRDMLDKCKSIESIKTIERWRREWGKTGT